MHQLIKYSNVFFWRENLFPVPSSQLQTYLHKTMRATYKLGRDVITEFEAQNAGNSISGVQISKKFSGGVGGMPGIGMSHRPRSGNEAGSALANIIWNWHNYTFEKNTSVKVHLRAEPLNPLDPSAIDLAFPL